MEQKLYVNREAIANFCFIPKRSMSDFVRGLPFILKPGEGQKRFYELEHIVEAIRVRGGNPGVARSLLHEGLANA